MTTAGTAPAHEPTDEVVSPGPVLAVFAHPDDETLLAGGLLALAAERGARVVVVTATRGERGEMIGAPWLEGTDGVADVRARENAAALGALGVREHRYLDELASTVDRWTDSGMAWVGPGAAGPSSDAPASALTAGDLEVQAGALAALVRELRPVVVVSDEEGGSYGHPDHRRTHAIVVRALDLLVATGDLLPVHAVVTTAQDRHRVATEAVRAQVATEQPLGALAQPLTAPGGEEPTLVRPAVDLEVDTSAVAPRVLAALRCYPSQVQGATIPVLDAASSRAGASSRTRRLLSAENAALGWYALSNGVAQPILGVVGLTAVRGGGDRLRAALPWAPSTSSSAESADPALQPLVTPPSAGRVAGVVACLLLGLLVGVTTTIVHRWHLAAIPLGMVLAIATVVVGALTARSFARGAGLLGYAVGAVAAVQLLAFVTAGGDVLVPGDALGSAWLLGSVLGIGVAAFLPARWVGRGA